MPKGILQEKFQRTMQRPAEEPKAWTTPKAVRRVVVQESQHYAPIGDKAAAAGKQAEFDAPRTNRMPPGQEIMDQVQSRQYEQPYSNAGATDESNSVNAAMLIKGYQRQQMRPEDEMYNDEHEELFYGTAEVDGDVGFVERNNYLDRT